MDEARQTVGAGADWLACRDATTRDRQRGAVGEQALGNLLILSDIRFLREGLAEVLQKEGAFAIVGLAADVDEALAASVDVSPHVVLIDVSLPDGLAAVQRLRNLAPQPQIVALALSETEAAVIAWAEAGISGYVPRSTALSDLVSLLGEIMRGEQTCSRKVAAGLLRRIARLPGEVSAAADASRLLTAREEQVARLVGAGLSNKEIARRLNIGLATTKSHVHNLLGKLELQRRTQVARWMRANPPSFSALWHGGAD
jgi:two-component system nitrate/nitrite response regulator NarL